MRLVFILIAGYVFISFAGAGRQPQNTINGGSFALRSGGSPSGDDWVLNANGYVGTYITLDAPGTVILNVTASGFTDDATSPRMNIVVNDSVAGWDVASGFNNYSTTLGLPAGAHFVRIEFNNDAPTANRALTVRGLEALGAAISNTNSDANALAAAKTYIDNYRKGTVTVKLPSIAPGATARVELISHAFNIGAITSGFTSYPDLADNPLPGSPAHSYQQFVNNHFNALVPSNGGKWAYNEETRDVVTMEAIDAFLNYASTRGLRARMHNLIWDTNQQPAWAQSLISQAVAGDASAKEMLRQEIIERIDYYVRSRAKRYVELDVFNESLHQPRYWRIFGAQGTAEIFNEVAGALNEAGSDARTMLNEFNVLQFSTNPGSGGSDPYANWYRAHIEEIRNAGGKMGGVGVQYYADLRANIGSNAHSAARIMQAFQNLAVTGLPVSLTEFGVVTNGGAWDSARATLIMEETMRMTFGAAGATGFMFWQLRATSPDSFGLVGNDWNLTPAGARFEQIMAEWDTSLTTTVSSDRTISFAGFYGDYELTIDGREYPLTLVKGVTTYVIPGLQIPARPSRRPRVFPSR
ncbi:MAG TPA: endo-1,4-beta-xylanase [Blastocatellia bacterium]|nr:endo-1,4-beta-xylanase [Blastocatellia bacterium]